MNGLLLGFLVGFLIYPWFGPVGVLLGGAVGLLADVTSHRRLPGTGGQMRELVHRLFTLWGYIAGNGQGETQVQVLFLQNVMVNQLHLRPADAAAAQEAFQQALLQCRSMAWTDVLNDVRGLSSELYSDFFLDDQTLLWIYATSRRLAVLGQVRPGLVELLDTVARSFGIFDRVGTAGVEGSRSTDQHQYEEAWSQFRPGASASPEAYTTLGLSPQATQEQIKKAYRSLARKHHPDTLSHLSDNDLEKKRAAERFLQIQQAYDRIRQARQF